MPLLIDESLDFQSANGSMSRCTVRVFAPPAEAREDGYIVLLVDDETSCGTSVTNAAETIAALVCAKHHIPRERAQFIECYDFRHTSTGHDGNGHEQTFARVRFDVPTEAGAKFDYIHGASLGKPAWTHIDKDSVEILIGEDLM